MTSNSGGSEGYHRELGPDCVGASITKRFRSQGESELDPQFDIAYDQMAIICGGTEQPEAAAENEQKLSGCTRKEPPNRNLRRVKPINSTSPMWFQPTGNGQSQQSLESAKSASRCSA